MRKQRPQHPLVRAGRQIGAPRQPRIESSAVLLHEPADEAVAPVAQLAKRLLFLDGEGGLVGPAIARQVEVLCHARLRGHAPDFERLRQRAVPAPLRELLQDVAALLVVREDRVALELVRAPRLALDTLDRVAVASESGVVDAAGLVVEVNEVFGVKRPVVVGHLIKCVRLLLADYLALEIEEVSDVGAKLCALA